MGNKILVSVFDSERTAFEGLTALKDLHRDGDITLYASTVIAKDAAGALAVRKTADRGPLATLAGVVTGGLVGLLGGPAGAAVGAYIGGFGGLMYDMFKVGVSMDFVDEVAASLTPGKAAVIADVDEMWVTPIETRHGALGGITFRFYPGEVIDAELIRETDAAQLELEILDAELRESSAEAKENVKETMAAQRRKLAALVDRFDDTLEQEQAEFEARLATLREQEGKAREREHQVRAHDRENRRKRIDARIEELKTSHEARTTKLEEARQRAKDSI